MPRMDEGTARRSRSRLKQLGHEAGTDDLVAASSQPSIVKLTDD